MIKTELVVTTTHAAIAAEQAGASRIELCQHLEVGGITPSIGLVQSVCDHVEFPVHVLIRCRRGNFCYNQHEVGEMVRDVRAVVEAGADAFVIGALTSSHEVDAEAMQRFLDAADGCPITFHRAFDVAADPYRAFDAIAQLGMNRILTSGQQATAPEGSALIAELVKRAGEQLTILPGSGINAGNVAQLVQQTGASEVHFSAVKRVPQQAAEVAMGNGSPEESTIEVFDAEKAQAVFQALS